MVGGYQDLTTGRTSLAKSLRLCSASSKVMPLCLGASGSVRAGMKKRSAWWAPLLRIHAALRQPLPETQPRSRVAADLPPGSWERSTPPQSLRRPPLIPSGALRRTGCAPAPQCQWRGDQGLRNRGPVPCARCPSRGQHRLGDPVFAIIVSPQAL